MKTPREILFDRHRHAESSLDAVRKTVLAEEVRKDTSNRVSGLSPIVPIAAIKLWRELVLPFRQVWCALAAAWIVIVALHVASTDVPKSAARSAGRSSSASNPEMQVAVREQRLMRQELLGVTAPPDGPRAAAPPRSEGRERARVA